MYRLRNAIVILVGVFVLLTVWQVTIEIISQYRINRNLTSLEAFIPTPTTIAKTIIREYDLIASHGLYTMGRAATGYIIGSISALLICAVFTLIPTTRKIFYPLMFGMNSFPIVSLAPVIILIFGQGSFVSIVSISAIITYFPILITADKALQNVNPDTLDLMKALKSTDWQTFKFVRVPQSLPAIFPAFKLAIPGSIIGATMGEWLGSRHGLGHLMTISMYQLKPGLLYATLICIVMACLIGLLMVDLIEYNLLKWRRN